MFGHEGLGLDPDDEPFFRGPPSSSALAASSRESLRKGPCRISAKNLISLLRIASVFTASHGAKTVNGWNGQRLIGNSSSTMCAQDFSNLMGGSFWSSIGARTALHFSHRNCARSLSRKARGSFVGRPCWAADPAERPRFKQRSESGERMRLACWRSRPRDRELFSPTQSRACSVDLRRKSKLQADGFGEGAESGYARARALPNPTISNPAQSQPSSCSILEMSSANRL